MSHDFWTYGGFVGSRQGQVTLSGANSSKLTGLGPKFKLTRSAEGWDYGVGELKIWAGNASYSIDLYHTGFFHKDDSATSERGTGLAWTMKYQIVYGAGWNGSDLTGGTYKSSDDDKGAQISSEWFVEEEIDGAKKKCYTIRGWGTYANYGGMPEGL